MKLSLTILTAITFCLASIVVRGLGELIVLRHPPTNNDTERDLTCLSENDDAALIWNDNLETDVKLSSTDFKPKKPPANVPDCAIWNPTRCLARWKNINDWEMVNSADRPMSPVLDYRWEGFKEFVFNEDERNQQFQHVRKFEKSIETIVFSIRGSRGAIILLCEYEQLNNGPCISIIFGDLQDQRSKIQTCTYGNGGTCTILDFISRKAAGEILETSEWRTFTLKWNETESKILVLRATDNVDKPFLIGILKVKLNNLSNLFIKSDVAARVRFHFYDYYWTVNRALTLYSQEFDHYDKNFCVELLVGLCPKCELRVVLEYGNGDSVKTLLIQKINGTEASSFNGVLRWQSVKLNKQLDIPSTKFHLIIQNFVNYVINGSWAIGNVRMCEPVDTVRVSTITTKRENGIPPKWPIVKCQKLSYEKIEIVDSRSDTLINATTRESDQPIIDSWLKSCGDSCKSLGKNLSICSPSGCTCDQGFDKAGHCNPDFQPPPEGISDIGNIEVKSLSATAVTLQWSPSISKNENTVHYNISIKRDKLIGCSDLNKPTPEQKEILQTTTELKVTFKNLHPYATYTATVLAYTTISGKPKTKMFQTPETNIPTSKVSHLRLREDNRTILWDEPHDCTTITGPYKLKMLVFEGVSESVKYLHVTKYTKRPYFEISNLDELAHYERYRVRIYVMRGENGKENSSCYESLDWRTPPTKPNAVNHLKIYEADSDRRTFSLRWLEPQPPNGEIESYNLSINGETKPYMNIIKEICDRNEKYVCLRNLPLPKNFKANYLEIEIYARNKNVIENGNVTTVSYELNKIFTIPSKPQNLTAIPKAHGIVNLEWAHPSISYTKIVKFNIRVEVLKTRLQSGYSKTQFPIDEYSISKKQKSYTRKLYLLTSTSYKIFVTAVNEKNLSSSEAQVNTSVNAGVEFVSKFDQVSQNGTLINLKVPSVVNATVDTMVSVKVNGVLKCKQNTVSSLVVDKYNPKINEPKQLTIDANNIHGNGSNCSLDIGKSYNFTVEVRDPDSAVYAFNKEVSKPGAPNDLEPVLLPTSLGTTLAWLVSFLIILVICTVLIFVAYRKYKRVPKQPRQPGYVEPISLLSRPTGSVSNSTRLTTQEVKPSIPQRPSYLEIIPPSPTTTPINDWPAVDTTTSSPQPEATEDQSSDHVYIVPNEPDSCCVSMENFAEYAKSAATSRRLHSQFVFLHSISPSSPCEYGGLPENVPKNRNGSMPACDHSRVVLEKIPGDPHSDYINASYIKGYKKERAYIAAQGPKSNTVNDFWRMVWQEEVRVICMLTNVIEGGETKCEKYWPDAGSRMKYGDFYVWNTNDQVTHLHYTGWPELGVPTYLQSLVDYLRKLEQTPAGNGPVVVHCSTGDDRTGTIILCAICLHQALAEKVIDVMAVTEKMRYSRANMVGTLQQYVLAHVIITESLTSWPTQIPCADVLSNRMNKLRIQLPLDMKRLTVTTWQLQALQYSAAASPYPTKHLSNDQNPEIVQDKPEVIYDDVMESERNQINAVIVDGVKAKKQYLACWLPSPLTLPNFWEFVVERDIKLIIILQCSNPRDPTCCDIMPDESITVPLLKVQVEKQTACEKGEYFTNEKLRITGTSEANARSQSLTVLTCKGWGCGTIQKPPTPTALISLWRASEKIPRKEGQTLVLCHDGVTGCGLYLAMSFLLERMAVERECDVISAVKAVRRSNAKFVQLTEQCEYLYDAAQAYAECFQCYANFS